MLKDIVTKSIQEFQYDCLELCKNHYPTVHNKGMSEQHLAKTFLRRMHANLKRYELPFSSTALETATEIDIETQFRVSTSQGTVWLLSQHLLNAGSGHRNKLLKQLSALQLDNAFAIQPNDLMVILCDHWISKSCTSRQLLNWWLGESPANIDDYSKAGLALEPSNHHFVTLLDKHYNLSPCYLTHAHPLLHKQTQQPVLKYLQLYAIVEWQR